MGLVGRDERTAHVLVIPLTTHGHITPTLRLAKELARKGIAITFVSFKDEITRLTSADTSSEMESLGFRLIALENPVFDEPEKPHEIPYKIRDAFEPLLEKLLADKRSSVAGPTCILSDMFLPWTQDAAEKLQIPRYAFVTSGAIFAKAMQGFADLFGHRLAISETADEIVKYEGSVCNPGLFPLRYHELPNPILTYPAEFQRRCKSLVRSTGVLVNSFYDMEEQMIETWTMPGASGSEHTKVQKIYPVGPFFSTSFTVPDIKIVHHLEDSAKESLLWLGCQPSCSVLYIAFGSAARFRLSPRHINELALGLEYCKQRFLWVLPQSKVSSDKEAPSIKKLLPPGFEGRVGDHGCIVTGWVPQLQILAHSATAAFLTHTGWNSSLESVMNGVPMISWPQGAEQHLNCRYLVDHLKVAIQLQTGAENILHRKEVDRAVRLLMLESEGKAIRRRVEDLQRKGAAAVAEGGSRSRTLEELVDDIKLH